MRPIGVVVHHSATVDGRTFSWPAMRRYHVEDKGWRDIGYHYGIEDVGGHLEVVVGRMENEVGAHAHGHNEALGVCLVGNWDDAPPDPARLELLTRLVRSLMETHNILSGSVFPHRAFADKTCPGRAFPWEAFRAGLLARTTLGRAVTEKEAT